MPSSGWSELGESDDATLGITVKQVSSRATPITKGSHRFRLIAAALSRGLSKVITYVIELMYEKYVALWTVSISISDGQA